MRMSTHVSICVIGISHNCDEKRDEEQSKRPYGVASVVDSITLRIETCSGLGRLPKCHLHLIMWLSAGTVKQEDLDNGDGMFAFRCQGGHDEDQSRLIKQPSPWSQLCAAWALRWPQLRPNSLPGGSEASDARPLCEAVQWSQGLEQHSVLAPRDGSQRLSRVHRSAHL